ncbi:9493_t:CDS:2, partial [Paraglomus occultum]
VVLSKHETEWLTSYIKGENWIAESIKNIKTEERLYEEARNYIIEQFNFLESESQTDKTEGFDVTKDLSFKSTKKSKTEEEDVDEEFDYIEEDDEFEEFDDDNELCEDEYDDSDTTVVGILRVKIDQASDILSGGMGVRAFKVNSQGAAKKGTPAYTADSAYGVHCVPVRNAKGQLVFEIFDKTLTDFNAEFLLTLSDLITRNSDGLYNKKQALEKSEQINIPGGSKCKIRLNAQFYSTRSESGRFDFSKDTVDINDLYRLIGMTFNASLSDVSNNLALSFKVESASDFFHALATRIGTDKQLMSRYVTDDGSLVYDEPSTIPETKSEILPSAPIADDPLNKPKSVSTDFISISQSVYS